jgi:hypothetical protein
MLINLSMKKFIQLLAMPVLAAGLSVLVLTGCGKGSESGSTDVVTLDELNRALSVMAMSPQGAPKNVSDLTNFPSIKGRPLPTPPAGKKFVVDPATRQVVAVDQ